MNYSVFALKVTVLFLFVFSSIQAQSIEEDFDKMVAAYKDVRSLYVEMENFVYKGDELQKQSSSTIRKRDGEYLYKLEEHSMLINKKYVVMVDKRNYNIIFDSWSSEKGDQLSKMYIPSKKELLESYPEVVFKGMEGDLKQYRFQNPKEAISTIDLFFDAKTGFVKKAVYFHNPKLIKGDMRTELNLKVINIKPNFSEDTFSEKQFVTIKNGKGEASRAYKKYTVRNAGRKQ